MSSMASGWADRALAASLERASGLSREAWLLSLIDEAKSRSRAPLSRFHVGAVGLGGSGAVYLGANIEFAKSQLCQTIHAEQSVVINAMTHGETRLVELAISAAPCGSCRQFLKELVDADGLSIWLAPERSYTLADFLPASFGPSDLGLEGGLLAPQDNALVADDRSVVLDAAARAALDAANRSYAPYSKAFAGCVLVLDDGSLWPGSYVENAAFNPSLSPGQTALVGLTMAGRDPSTISRVVLAEAEASQVDHHQTLLQMLVSLGVASTPSIIGLIARKEAPR